MTPRRLLLAFLCGALLLTAVNFLYSAFAANTVPRQVLRKLSAPGRVDVLGFGNSLMAAALAPSAFESGAQEVGAPLRARNAGMGGTAPVHSLVMLRATLASHPEIKTAIWGFMDCTATVQDPGNWREFLGNQTLLFYTETATAARHLAPNRPWEQWLIRLLGHLPLFRERSILWGKVEIQRRRLGELGLPPVEHGEFGREEDFKAMEADNSSKFLGVLREEMARPFRLNDPMEECIDLCHSNQIRLVFVEMPMTPEHCSRFYAMPEWSQYRSRLRTYLAQRGVEYVDAHDWFPNDLDFRERLHLKSTAADAFSRRLAKLIASPN